MPTYKAPVDDVQFLLNDVFHMERYGNLPGFADASPDVARGDPRRGRQARRGSASQPLNRVGDLEGCKRNADGSVTTPTGLQGSLQAIRRRRLDGPLGAAGVWRAGPARHAAR